MENVENGEECATAHLIAASPKLLEELQKADQIITDLWAMLQKHNVPDSDPDWPYLRQQDRIAAIAKATALNNNQTR